MSIYINESILAGEKYKLFLGETIKCIFKEKYVYTPEYFK